MKKRIFAMLLTLILLFSLCSVSAFASGGIGLTVSANKDVVLEGETVTVSVALSSNPGLVGLTIQPNYNSNLFELTATDGSGSCIAGFVGGPKPTWFDISAGMGGYNIYATGHLITFTFTAKTNVYGLASFSVSVLDGTNVAADILSGYSDSTYVTVMLKEENCTEHNMVGEYYKEGAEPTCEADGIMITACDKCGKLGERTVAALGHSWIPASYIGQDDIIKEATCTADGEQKFICENDNSHTKIEPIEAKGHDIINHDGQDAACDAAGWKAYETCSRCDYTTYEAIPAKGHDWDLGVWVSQPTCTEEGSILYTCQNDSSHTKYGSFRADGHGYAKICTFTWTEDVANNTWTASYSVDCDRCDYVATGNAVVTSESMEANSCLEAGKVIYTASVALEDGSSYEDTKTIIGAAGPHDWDEGTVTTDPTCDAPGVKTFTCQNDETHTKQTGVEALGHDITNHDGRDATCTIGGWEAYETCSRCNYSTYETIPAKGHDTIDHDGQDATCTADGWKAYETCSRCDYSTYETIPAKGHDTINHDGQDATCDAAGWEAYETCSRCDYSTYEEIPALGHDWDDGKVTADPTCEDEGVKTYTCQNDASHTKTEAVDPIGHDWDNGKVTTDPTCEDEGVKTYTCQNDASHTKTEAVDPIGHDWNDGEITTDPTCEDKGEKTYTCQNDNTHTKVEPVDALGHDYADEAAFTWTEDTENATWTAVYSVECESANCDHVASGNAVISESSSTAANCQEIGTTTYTVTITLGDKSYTESKVIDGAAGPHDWDEGTITTDPTCTEKGVRTYTCELDDSHTKVEDVDPLGHSYESKTVAGKDADGHWYSCDNGCDVPSEPEDHIEGTPATCVSGALCDVCDGEFGEINPEAHKWNEGEIDLDPDCITGTPGNKHFICELDETHTKDEEVPAEHTWDEGTVTREPTTSLEGERTYHCTVDGCEGTKTEAIAKLTPSGSGSSSGGSSGSNNGYGPKTGDESNPVLWISLVGLCLVSIVLLLASRKSKKRGRHGA